MAKDIWAFRFRAHFARNVSGCREALGKAMLTLCSGVSPDACARLTTTVASRRSRAEFSPGALESALDTHAGAPTWCYCETVIDDGKARDRQSFRAQLLTWNKWEGKRAPKPDDYRTPSHIQCFWAIDSGYYPTAQELNLVIAQMTSSANLFYAWADLCLCPAASMGLKAEKRTPKPDDPVRPHADLYDGDDIDYREIVRGAFWFNCLGPGHIDRLGGVKRVLHECADFSPRSVSEDHVTLSLAATPPVETTDEVFSRHARLAAYLKEIYPPVAIRAIWKYKFKEKLRDGRLLNNGLWLRRFIDKEFLSEHVFRLASEPAKKAK